MSHVRTTDGPGREGPAPIQAYLEALHRRHASVDEGEVATYIPELSKADPNGFGIVIATVDGRIYEVGDSGQPFTIQSISKALVYGLALEDAGPERVRATVSVEPSGEAFNSISLEPGTGRPLNPMINAGAIATASLVAGADLARRVERMRAAFSTYAGRELDIDEAVFRSERETGHRNRAIGHLLRSFGVLQGDPEPTLDLYFKQCSVRVTARDLALMAATLANGGLNPLTGARAVAAEHVGSILSVMTTCGVYDFTGEWVYRVGLPAKSGVGGGILAVLPGQLGVGVYSPRLDARGNSVRGVRACEDISRDLGLHFLRPPRLAAGTVRARYSLATVRSKRQRPAAELQALDRLGPQALVLELQGDLRFATLEPVLHEAGEAAASMRLLLLDFKRVTGIDAAAARLLAALVNACGARGQQVVLSRVRRGELMSEFNAGIDPRHARACVFQPQLDLALEWCERGLLQGQHPTHAVPRIEGLHQHALCAGLSEDGLRLLQAHVTLASWDAGTTIVARGDPADAVYLLLKGEVSVTIELPLGSQRRLATLSAGMAFGEMALVNGGQRGADVRADTPVECAVLTTEAFQALEREHPAVAMRLLHGLLRTLAQTTARLTAEVAALEG